MSIITYQWNGSAISQTDRPTVIAKFNIPADYINATQMCKANGKFWGHYAERKSTKLYLEGLSADIGIPISELVISIIGDDSAGQQGTWIHPLVATDMLQWFSVPFRIWANKTLP